MSIRPRRSLLNKTLRRPSALRSIPRAPEQLWLDKNENLDQELMALTNGLLADLSPLALATYPEAGALYRKLATWVGVCPESLLLTPGSDGAIRLVFETFVEHGDRVIHTLPTFAMYPVYCQMFGAETCVVEYQRGVVGPTLDTGAIIESVAEEKPKLLCLPNPDSPTGTVVAPDVLRALLDACEAAGTVLLLDEAYHPFHECTGVPWTQKSRNLIVARTFAKAWGVAGLRVGYAVAHPETIALLHLMRPMYEVSTIAVEFMARMLDHQPEMNAAVSRLKAGKTHFVGEMRRMGFNVLPTSGNFVHVEFGARGPAIHAALANRVLYRAAFDHPSLEGYSRFSVAPQPIMSQVSEMIENAVKATP
jgi:histidinol-phosphate aminotransferase